MLTPGNPGSPPISGSFAKSQLQSAFCHILQHSQVPGTGHLWGAMALPSPACTGSKTLTLYGHVLPCFKLFLGSCRDGTESNRVFIFRLQPLPSSSQPGSGTRRLFWAPLPSPNFLSLQCLPTSLSGWAIYALGPLYMLPFARSLTPAQFSTRCPRPGPPTPPSQEVSPRAPKGALGTLVEGCHGTGGEPYLWSCPCVCVCVCTGASLI